MYAKISFNTQRYTCVHLLLPLLYSPTYSIDKLVVDHQKVLQMILHVQFMANLHVYKVLNSVKYATFYFLNFYYNQQMQNNIIKVLL